MKNLDSTSLTQGKSGVARKSDHWYRRRGIMEISIKVRNAAEGRKQSALHTLLLRHVAVVIGPVTSP